MINIDNDNNVNKSNRKRNLNTNNHSLYISNNNNNRANKISNNNRKYLNKSNNGNNKKNKSSLLSSEISRDFRKLELNKKYENFLSNQDEFLKALRQLSETNYMMYKDYISHETKKEKKSELTPNNIDLIIKILDSIKSENSSLAKRLEDNQSNFMKKLVDNQSNLLKKLMDNQTNFLKKIETTIQKAKA